MNSYLIPYIYPFYYIHTVSYYEGFPEGKMEHLAGEDQDRYIFYFEDTFKKRVFVDKVDPLRVKTEEMMNMYTFIAEEEGFKLVGIRLPYTRHIITARDTI